MKETNMNESETKQRGKEELISAQQTMVAEVSALIDALKLGEARALLDEIAAALGEGNIEVVGLRTMLHFMDTTGDTKAS